MIFLILSKEFLVSLKNLSFLADSLFSDEESYKV